MTTGRINQVAIPSEIPNQGAGATARAPSSHSFHPRGDSTTTSRLDASSWSTSCLLPGRNTLEGENPARLRRPRSPPSVAPPSFGSHLIIHNARQSVPSSTARKKKTELAFAPGHPPSGATTSAVRDTRTSQQAPGHKLPAVPPHRDEQRRHPGPSRFRAPSRDTADSPRREDELGAKCPPSKKCPALPKEGRARHDAAARPRAPRAPPKRGQMVYLRSFLPDRGREPDLGQ